MAVAAVNQQLLACWSGFLESWIRACFIFPFFFLLFVCLPVDLHDLHYWQNQG